MTLLIDSLRDWNSGAFSQTMKRELEGLQAGTLPLDQCLTQGGWVDDREITVTVLHVSDDDASIRVKIGIFFSEIIAGCSCGDEPFSQNAYCEMGINLDKATAEAEFSVIPGWIRDTSSGTTWKK